MVDYLVYLKVKSVLSKFINSHQHGFVEGNSTISNSAVYYDYIISKLKTLAIVESVYTDLVRVFDMVNIDLLIRPLSAYGINGGLLKWLKGLPYLLEAKKP